MKHYAIIDPQGLVSAITSNQILSDKLTLVEVSSEMASTLKNRLGHKPKIETRCVDGIFSIKTRSITKRELVDKLISINKTAEFNAMLNALPLAEKLRWEASPTISPEYPFIRANRDDIIAALAITSEQFDSIFQ